MKSTELIQLDNSTDNVLTDDNTYIEVNGTPFTLVKVKEEWAIVMGDEIASKERFTQSEEAEDYIRMKPYELIIMGAVIFMNKIKEQKK